MPRPNSTSTIIRPDLGQTAYELFTDRERENFVAQRIFPLFNTRKRSGQYPVIPIEALAKISDTTRAPRGGYQRDDWEFSMSDYSCQEYGWEEPIDDTERLEYQDYFSADVVAMERATNKLLLGYEKRVIDAVTSTSNVTLTSTAAVAWSTAATCTPLADVEAGKEAMRLASGIIPNCIVMNDKVFNYLRQCAEIEDRVKYTEQFLFAPRQTQISALAQYFDVPYLWIAGTVYDSTGRGKSKTLARLWPDSKVLLAKVSTGGLSLREPCLGRTFLWTEDSPNMLTTETYREEQTRADVMRVRNHTDECFIFTNAGYLITSVA